MKWVLLSESSSVGRASAFQAEGRGFESRLSLYMFKNICSCQCSSGVEHFHGKEGVASSNLAIGSMLCNKLLQSSSAIVLSVAGGSISIETPNN